jgi:hypothetical protein
MAYFYNSYSGEVNIASQSLNPVEEASFLANEARLHSGAGWHEYPDQAAMLAAIQANHWPAANSGNPGNVAAGAAATGAKKAAQAAADAITKGWKLVFGNTTGLLGRILKVVFGGVLVIAGLTRITGAKKDIISVAGNAVKEAVV